MNIPSSTEEEQKPINHQDQATGNESNIAVSFSMNNGSTDPRSTASINNMSEGVDDIPNISIIPDTENIPPTNKIAKEPAETIMSSKRSSKNGQEGKKGTKRRNGVNSSLESLPGRFHFKLIPKDKSSIRQITYYLQRLIVVSCFCVYSKKSDEEKLRIYVKLRRRERPSVFNCLRSFLDVDVYTPKNTVINFGLHYGTRKIFQVYDREDDERQHKELEDYIEDMMFRGSSFISLLSEAIETPDKRMFFSLLHKSSYYSHVANLIRTVKAGRPKNCTFQ